MPETDKDFEQAKKRLDLANDARKYEITLFWQRSLFFWGFSTTAIAAFGGAVHSGGRNLQFAAACVGLVSAIVWTLANRSSKYWQKVWEKKLENLQSAAIGSDLFSKESNKALKIEETWWWGAKHFSVSKLAVALSDFAVIVWIGLIFKSSPLWPLMLQSWVFATDWFVEALMLVVTIISVSLVFCKARPDAKD